MRIDIITLFPEYFKGAFDFSIIKRAINKNLIEIHVHQLRDYAKGKYKQTDDYQYGGGSGMVLMIEPIDKCISALKSERNYDEIIYLSPDGELFNQNMANRLSLLKNVILLCGHYKGVDERVRQYLVTSEISIGNYVLSGGEPAAIVIIDAITRLLPGAIGDEESALTDSFQNGLVSPPVYTRPANYKGWKVPDILLSGHEKKISEWRFEQSIERTKKRRPDLLENF